MDWVLEPGQFKLYIGKNSQEVVEVPFEILGNSLPKISNYILSIPFLFISQ
jgi:hypothetical protein